jgi:hypothetical protein
MPARAVLQTPPVLSYRRPQRFRLVRAIHLVTPKAMALHFTKGSAIAGSFPLLAFSCIAVVGHAGWGILLTAAGLIAFAATVVSGGVCFFVAAKLRLAITGARVRLLYVSRGLITWTGAANPLVVVAILALVARLTDREPDWRFIVPVMGAPAAIMAALIPRPLRRR